MFTGIIQEIGTIKRISRQGEFYQLEICAAMVTSDLKVGDSVAVNGVCLTVTSADKDKFCADVMSETISRTTLKEVKANDKVNLEPALTLSTRLGGHMVSGHVDDVGTIIEKVKGNNSCFFAIRVSSKIQQYIAVKGSVAIDGISLTVTEAEGERLSVAVIPHTLDNTMLGSKQPGDRVNIEVDLLARYAVNYLEKSKSKIDWEEIARNGI